MGGNLFPLCSREQSMSCLKRGMLISTMPRVSSAFEIACGAVAPVSSEAGIITPVPQAALAGDSELIAHRGPDRGVTAAAQALGQSCGPCPGCGEICAPLLSALVTQRALPAADPSVLLPPPPRSLTRFSAARANPHVLAPVAKHHLIQFAASISSPGKVLCAPKLIWLGFFFGLGLGWFFSGSVSLSNRR